METDATASLSNKEWMQPTSLRVSFSLVLSSLNAAAAAIAVVVIGGDGGGYSTSSTAYV